MLLIGLQKLTLLDYPGRTACTLFTGGCNLRCPFCHNADLVLTPNQMPVLKEEEVFSFLSKRRQLLDGVCVTGGEPTLQPDLADFLRRVRSLGYDIKLDTNGTRPAVLLGLLQAGLVQYVAMDIKSSPEGYAEASGTLVDLSSIRESIRLLMHGDIPYEFRTTVVDELHDEQTIRALSETIAGASAYFLQGFKDSGRLIDGSHMHAASDEKMNRLLSAAREFVPAAQLRGIG